LKIKNSLDTKNVPYMEVAMDLLADIGWGLAAIVSGSILVLVIGIILSHPGYGNGDNEG